MSDKVSSFGIESLLWNVDVSVYNKYSGLRFILDEVIGFLNENRYKFSGYLEANGIKTLFPDEVSKKAYEAFVINLGNYYEYEV